MESWNDGDAILWAKSLSEPHMVKGLRILARRVRPRRSVAPIAQGFDLTPVFIKSAGFYEGAQETLDIIQTMSEFGQNQTKHNEIPEAFSHIIKENI